jgi:hypothetical protein
MHLIDNEQDRIEFGVRASNMIREKCSMDSYRERILEILSKINDIMISFSENTRKLFTYILVI